jgi:hypothetical protein
VFPVPHGEPLDEFAHIPSNTRPPLVAIAAAALALFLAFRLRHDIAFALSPKTPVEISDARVLANVPLERLPINRYVEVKGRPERESAVILDTKGSWKFNQFFRLRGTRGRVFVRRVADPLPVPLAEHDVFSGRLVRFSELSFAESIGRYFAAHVSGTHFFAPEALVKGLAGAPGGDRVVIDRAGESVTLHAQDRLALDVARPGEYRIELLPERKGDLEKVRAVIRARGGTSGELEGKPAPDASLVFPATIPDAERTATFSALGELGRGVRFRPARDTIEVAVGDLVVAGPDATAITLKAAGQTPTLQRMIAVDRLISVRTRAAVEVPPDAVLLLEGEAPRNEVKSLVVLAFLAAFAAINLLSLRRIR